jgi:hypothetical protein
MNFKSIFGSKPQEEIDEIISDPKSTLHLYMEQSDTKAKFWVTVNDLISAIEERLIDTPQMKTKLVTKNSRFSTLNEGEVEICNIGFGYFDEEEGSQFILVATEYASEEEGAGKVIESNELLSVLKSKANAFGNWPIVSISDQFITPNGSVIRSYGTNNFPYLIWNFQTKELWLLESPEEQWPEYKNA